MARARLLKPGFFANEDLAELPLGARLLFAGLWTIADREGRLEDRPKRIKAELFPYDDLDVDQHMGELARAGFILRYSIDGGQFVQIISFTKHQHPHVREPQSMIPPPDESQPCTSPAPGKPSASPVQGDAEHQPGPAVTGDGNRITETETVSGHSVPVVAVAPSPKARGKRPVKALTDEQMAAILTDFADLDDAREQIQLALGHANAKKHSDMNLYVRNWLRNTREWRADRRNGNGRTAKAGGGSSGGPPSGDSITESWKQWEREHVRRA